MEWAISRDKIKKAAAKISLGDETPQAYIDAARKLHDVAYKANPYAREFQQSGETSRVIFKRALKDLIEDTSPTTLAEAHVEMDELKFPPDTRKALLLELVHYTVIGDPSFGQTRNLRSMDPSDVIANVAGDVICEDDFKGRDYGRTPAERITLLQRSVNYLIQFNPSIYCDKDPNDWTISRRERQKAIEREKRSGKVMLTVFMER